MGGGGGRGGGEAGPMVPSTGNILPVQVTV